MKTLEGVRVVNLAVNLPGPAAARELGRMGAHVIKVEPPAGDYMEHYSSQWYRDMAKDHEIVRLDLKNQADMARLKELLDTADVLLTATRPAALERMGLGWDALHAAHPRLCQVAIVGYPAPRDNEAGHDLTYQAALGLLQPPAMPRALLADMAGAQRAVSEVLALLVARQRTGEGGYAQVALSDAVAFMGEVARYGLTAPGEILGGGVPEYRLYPAKEGWVAVAALEPQFRKRLEAELGLENSVESYKGAFATRTARQWHDWAAERDIPIAEVRDL
ncbi:CoA transferase [Fundidesulfovibrio butyratiphilus]